MLRREGLFDLQDEVGALPDLVGRGERRTDGGVLVVADAATGTGAALDDDLVAGFGERAGAGGRQRDALLARPDLRRHARGPRAASLARNSRISRLTSAGCS